MTTVRVIVADDHPVVRGGLRALLEAHGVEVVGEADDGPAAVEQALSLRPDVVLMDIEMPTLDGIAATALLLERDPDARVLALTMHADDAVVLRAIRAGAMGYLVKGSAPDQIIRAVRAVADGHVVLDGAVAKAVVANLRERRTDQPFPELTARERQVFDLLGRGLNNRVIADRLGLSAKTVANVLSNVLAKLHLADRNEAIVRAREGGLGPARPPS